MKMNKLKGRLSVSKIFKVILIIFKFRNKEELANNLFILINLNKYNNSNKV